MNGNDHWYNVRVIVQIRGSNQFRGVSRRWKEKKKKLTKGLWEIMYIGWPPVDKEPTLYDP